MESRTDRLSTLSNVHPLSSSLPPSQSAVNDSLVAFRTRARVFDPPIDDSHLARRTTALRQLNGISRSLNRKHRQSTSASSRSSLPSQPVVVRTYSAGANNRSAMSGRPRSGAGNAEANGPSVPLPQVQEFGIEGILQAIDPDIQNTLDAIAEICGRSRLSLANEYGSHRPPLGEIRAPVRPTDHGLLTVEEASSSNERLADENILIVGDDISTVDGRDHYSSTYGYLDPIHPVTRVMEYRNSIPHVWGERNATQQQAGSNRPATIRSSVSGRPSIPQPAAESSQNKAYRSYLPWPFRGKDNNSSSERGPGYSMVTQPVTSEVHLDAQADGTSHQVWEPDHPRFSRTSTMPMDPENVDSPNVDRDAFHTQTGKLSMMADVQGWLTRLRGASHPAGQDNESTIISAETSLRELLERQNARLMHAQEMSTTAQTGG